VSLQFGSNAIAMSDRNASKAETPSEVSDAGKAIATRPE
jgi:hypothetical protein